MNALIFVRGNDIKGQVAQCMEYAKKKGYEVECVMVGDGHEIASLMYELDVDIDRVLVRDMSRISRNAAECYAIQAELELDFGCKVEIAMDRVRSELEEIQYIQNIIKDAVLINKVKERITYRMSQND